MDALGHAWPQLVVLAEVAAAMLLGGMIGYERETANKPAGFRTHMMLAGACALLVGLGGSMLATFSRLHPGLISADPFRLVGGVLTALGFIGAGTIFGRRAARRRADDCDLFAIFRRNRRVCRTAAVVARCRGDATGIGGVARAANAGSRIETKAESKRSHQG